MNFAQLLTTALSLPADYFSRPQHREEHRELIHKLAQAHNREAGTQMHDLLTMFVVLSRWMRMKGLSVPYLTGLTGAVYLSKYGKKTITRASLMDLTGYSARMSFLRCWQPLERLKFVTSLPGGRYQVTPACLSAFRELSNELIQFITDVAPE